jgi:hypothetical protein
VPGFPVGPAIAFITLSQTTPSIYSRVLLLAGTPELMAIFRSPDSCSSPTQNGQRATMQTPQGFDATHGGELFPIEGE